MYLLHFQRDVNVINLIQLNYYVPKIKFTAELEIILHHTKVASY